MEIHYREAHPEDLPACVDLFTESVSDLLRRNNMPVEATPVERTLAFYQHALSTGIFHVAEAEGQLTALACAIVRDHLWFLAGFWARPGFQKQHIGMGVLQRAWDAGKQAGATHFFVWSSFDLPAMAAYMKLGMLPGTQILVFQGAPKRESSQIRGYKVEPLKKSFAMAMDQVTLGSRREVDHDFLERRGWRGRQVTTEGHVVGYYYLDGGSIGPGAWTADEHAAAVLESALREASASDGDVKLRVPGMNHAGLRFAFDAGLRLTGFAHLLMTAPFGHLERYLPSGPALF
jgi:GNAT superfamily N-acetyltransferase